MNLRQRLRHKIRVIKVILLLQACYFAVKVFPLNSILAYLLPSQVVTNSSSKNAKDALSVFASAIWRFSWLDTCLPRAIVLCRELRKAGVEAELVIGVKKDEGNSQQIKAHAWVQASDGTIFDAPDIDTKSYVPLAANTSMGSLRFS